MPTMYVPPFMEKLTNATGGALVDGRQIHKQLAKVVGQERHNDFLRSTGLDQPLAPPPTGGSLPFPELNAPPMPDRSSLGLNEPPPMASPGPLGGPISTDEPPALPPRPVVPPPPLPADRPPGTFGGPVLEETP